MDIEKTIVIFRKWRNGDVIALFPELLGDYTPYTCNSYMHIGQHGSANIGGLIGDTKLAKPEDYKDLYEELTSIGYNLEIRKRDSYKYQKIREKELSEIT